MMDQYQLANGLNIPKIGFGTWQIPDGEEAYRAVSYALEAGYRHIDTAQIYGNEKSVGQAVADSSIAREEIFLTTKVWNDQLDAKGARASIEQSMEKLGVTYLDLVLIHWPNPKAVRENGAWRKRNAEVWSAMEELYQEGKVRAIGVSNFMISHLDELLKTAKVIPHVNQVLLAPGCPQEDLVAYCRDKEILLEAYSPFGTGTLFQNNLAHELAEATGYSVAQVALAWSLAKGFLPLPKSSSPENIKANLDVSGLSLSPEALQKLAQLEGIKAQKNPDEVDF